MSGQILQKSAYSLNITMPTLIFFCIGSEYDAIKDVNRKEIDYMIDRYVLDKKCPKCLGLGRSLNPSPMKLTTVQKKVQGKLDDPISFVCTECNGTGKILPDEVKELLEYILS